MQEIKKLQKEIAETRAKIALGDEKNVKKVKILRHNLAQLMTKKENIK
jgi:ribosomal protein L29